MKKFVAVIVFLFLNILCFSQNRLSDYNTIGWLSTTITPSINKKWSGHIEYQWRRVNVLKDWQQSLLRLGINYKVNPQVTLHAGYGFIETFPYGTYNLAAVRKTFPEHRIYEQASISSKLGKTTVLHRLRLEQRWLGRFGTMEQEKPVYIYLNRFRYMARLDIPLNAKWYAAMYDEIFIGFGKNVVENVFDQNRFGIMAGYKAGKTFRVEGGIINQTVQLAREIDNKNVYQYNSGFIINTYINF